MVDMLMHELKNPLAGIKGASQLIESDLKGNSNLLELTQLITIESERIISLLDRMEHISNNNSKLECEYINIHEILNHCRSCLLYTSPSPRDPNRSRMPSSA